MDIEHINDIERTYNEMGVEEVWETDVSMEVLEEESSKWASKLEEAEDCYHMINGIIRDKVRLEQEKARGEVRL